VPAAPAPAASAAPANPLEVADRDVRVRAALNKKLTGLGGRVVAPQGAVSIPILGDKPAARAHAAAGPAPAGSSLMGPSSVEDLEPIYGPAERADIQGNTIPGFNKDHQHFLFLHIGDVGKCKAWLRWIAPLISSLDEVLAFVRAHRALRLRMGVKEPPLTASWVNIGFSHGAISRLVGPADADLFGDSSFRQGLSERSTYIGDPSDPKHPGHRRHWPVGGPKNEADILVIVAADESTALKRRVKAIADRARTSGLRLIFEQRGDTLPGNLRGHEHFGFKDGISQPGVRGRVSDAQDDFITPRYLDPSDTRSAYFGKPGQLLVWAGEFLLGEPRQDPENLTEPGSASDKFPAWAKLGSYVVCRRLLQDVPAFWLFAIAAAQALGLSTDHLAAMLVGRWQSGAPLMRAGATDDPALAADPWANNHFLYDDDTRPSSLKPITGYAGDSFPRATADVLGKIVPHFAHIRKMNPRDHATDLGKPLDSVCRMILRRGIPFGKPLAGVKRPSKSLLAQERGLMFVSYSASIEQQFEFLSRRWANSPLQPNSGGHDPIIGQAERRRDRRRFIDFPAPGGSRRISLPRDWVISSGGGYFFSPPIKALTEVLGA
jgi:Dyp-type peroxidase family